MYTEAFQEIFKRRFHGSSNIKGIDFQILYALYMALDMLDPEKKLEKLTLEGIEDIDLKPFQADNIYLQVKTSINSWHFCELSSPIINFVNLNKISSISQKFELILDFKPRQSIEAFFSKETLVENRRKLIKDFLKLKDVKKANITEKDIVNIISNCDLKYISKEELIKKIHIKIINFLYIHPNEAEYFSLSILYKFIDWSINRQTINKKNLLDFKVEYEESKSQSIAFEAYGKGLIERISWKDESQPSDYFEGKKTRSGHIALGLDVLRPQWLGKIKNVFETANICVIREASGQGKSTLAFRYAHDYWMPECTFSIKAAETLEQAEQISNYLKCLTRLGIMPTVIIDDINAEKRYFSNILQNCASHKIPFLLTARNDDYHNFAKIDQVSLEFVIPYFSTIEAKLIFQNLEKEGKIHANAISSDWAFEKISSPKCLIEFIYLITQGEMLYDRLSQQIKTIRLNNQSAKIDLLRKIIIADICQAPLNINRLLLKEISAIDYQEILKSIKDEFITIENDHIKGYHWVRSFHLLEILHEDFGNPAISALKTIPLIDDDKISEFIGNTIIIPNFDASLLIKNFKLILNIIDAGKYISTLTGIFKIGEYQFFLANKAIYDEGYRLYNDGVLFLFNSDHLPTIPIDLFEAFGDEKNMAAANKLSKQFINVPRGPDLVREFIKENKWSFEASHENLHLFGNLLDWSYWANIELIDLNTIDRAITTLDIHNLDISSFSLFSLSFFRKYPERHSRWFKENKHKIISKLENDLQCSIILEEDYVSITYINIKEGESLNDATVRRLNVIHSTIPFLKYYKGRYVKNLKENDYQNPKSNTNHDESYKDIPSESLFYQSDVQKNIIYNEIVESHYRVKTWYEFCSYYYELRTEIVTYSKNLCDYLLNNKNKFKEKNAPYISEKILHSYKKLPFEVEAINESFKHCTYTFNDFNNFLVMKSNLTQNMFDEKSKILLCTNFNNYLSNLPKMQHFFNILKSYSPEYFPFESLNFKEWLIATHLKSLLKIHIPNSDAYWDSDPEMPTYN